MKLFYDMLAVCKNGDKSNYLSFMFLMLIFEEICEFSRQHNNLQVLIKLFLEVQFIGFPPEMMQFRRYKALLIKYYPFYLIKNLSFLEDADPFKEITEKHREFKLLFLDVCKPMKIDGLDVGLVNPIDIVESKKLKSILSSDQTNAEQVLDMLRLEIEIWENFIYQISQFEKEEKKNYQCMLVN